jgi:hypothetical protein
MSMWLSLKQASVRQEDASHAVLRIDLPRTRHDFVCGFLAMNRGCGGLIPVGWN